MNQLDLPSGGVASTHADVPETVEAAITSRHSCRRYLDAPVSRERIHAILKTARWAPSGTNVQPWNVYVAGGEVKARLCEEILADYWEGGDRDDREYQYYPTDWFEPYLGRRRACGWGLYGALGIGKGEREKTRAQHARNFTFFDAPVGLVFTLDKRLEVGSWMDTGMFLQNVMIAARAEGLHTCPQAAFANYPGILRRHLGIPDSDVVLCGMAVGYRDPDAPENVWRTDREDVDTFTHWRGI